MCTKTQAIVNLKLYLWFKDKIPLIIYTREIKKNCVIKLNAFIFRSASRLLPSNNSTYFTRNFINACLNIILIISIIELEACLFIQESKKIQEILRLPKSHTSMRETCLRHQKKHWARLIMCKSLSYIYFFKFRLYRSFKKNYLVGQTHTMVKKHFS
jgi:hypothetical protein